ncbi:signal peptidase I [Paracoccus pacificus]|uniref:Signal peptidase I n=1 Tax=Paracoccus pacificus TaxID=1463598 RepID=A0ABW4RB01_9RHOB
MIVESRPAAPLVQFGRVSGRLSRQGYWPYVICVSALGALAAGLDSARLWVAVLVLSTAALAATVRRLHDTDRSGWWLLLLALPPLGLILLWPLLRPASRRRQNRFDHAVSLPDPWRWPAILGFAAIVGASQMLGLTVERSGEMRPTLLAGDLVLTNRLAFGAGPGSCAPVTCPPDWLPQELPKRGELFVFRTPEGRPRILRAAGLPGDRVSLAGGVVHVNRAALPQTEAGVFVDLKQPQGPARVLPKCANDPVGAGGDCVTPMRAETLPNGRRHLILDLRAGAPGDMMAERIVPPGQIFALADNRDDAIDSRWGDGAGGGMVPASAIYARPLAVVISGQGGSLLDIFGWRLNRIARTVE